MNVPPIAFQIVPHGSKLWKEAVALRLAVLRQPLGAEFSSQELDAEKHHVHVVGILNRIVVATAALVMEGNSLKMQRVAVAHPHRNQHIGKRLLEECEQYGQDHGFMHMYCHARDTAVRFYQQNKYHRSGDYFEEDGIPHLRMNKPLSV